MGYTPFHTYNQIPKGRSQGYTGEGRRGVGVRVRCRGRREVKGYKGSLSRIPNVSPGSLPCPPTQPNPSSLPLTHPSPPLTQLPISFPFIRISLIFNPTRHLHSSPWLLSPSALRFQLGVIGDYYSYPHSHAIAYRRGYSERFAASSGCTIHEFLYVCEDSYKKCSCHWECLVLFVIFYRLIDWLMSWVCVWVGEWATWWITDWMSKYEWVSEGVNEWMSK